jgi:mitochondrial chaperone BCS1
MQNKEHYKYEIEYFHPWYDYVNTYLGNFSDLKFLRIIDMKIGKPVYGLPYGKTEYIFNDSTIYINLEKDGEIMNLGSYTSYYTKLLLSSKSKTHLDSFLIVCKDYCYKKPEKKILIKLYKNGFWGRVSELVKRKLSSIFLEDNKKEIIINDIDNFFNNKKDYYNFSVPYKRNYLLYGPPGTGKTSLIYAIASTYNLDIHILTLNPSMNDQTLISCISKISSKSILLLEDIDSLYEMRQKNEKNNLVSFSCLLNILDGLSAKSGLITFITTNYINRLDPALLRAGRIDLKIEISYAKKQQIKNMIIKLYPLELKNFDNFWKHVKDKKIPMAAFQNFLFHCFQNKKNIDKEVQFLLNLLNNKQNNYSTMFA